MAENKQANEPEVKEQQAPTEATKQETPEKAPAPEKPEQSVPDEKATPAPTGRVINLSDVRVTADKGEQAPADLSETGKEDKGKKEQRAATLETGKPAPDKASKAGKDGKAEKTPKEKPLRDKTSQSKNTAKKNAPAKGAALGKDTPPDKNMPTDKDTAQTKDQAPTKDETPAKDTAPAVEAPTEPDIPPRPVEEQKIVYLKISELHPFHTFREHPFKVVDDSPRMKELTSSIKEQGVFTPATVRPEKDGNGYEVIAGHCRMRGSELAGLEELPCIIREMSDHEAVQEMKNSNKQRGDPLPSELAKLLDLEMEDIKHQGARLTGVAAGDVGKRSAEIVGENNGMNYKKVMRYIRLNSLVPELLDMVDAKKMGFMPAVELSFIKPKNQRLIAVSIEGEQSSPSLAQAQKLRELDKEGKLNGDIIDGILSEQKKEVDKVIISTAELDKYFGKEFTPRQMKDQIIALLDDWKAKQPPELTKPVKTTDKEL